MKVKEEYQGLSQQELLDKAYELGFNYKANSGSCSQCTVAALHALLDIDDVVVKVATSLSGGSAGQVVGTCGALDGGIIALDYFFGRPVENLSDKERIEANINAVTSARKISMLLADKFWKEYGTIICAQIQRHLFGRHYYFNDPDEAQKLSQAEADSAPRNCSHIVGNATRWVMEILLDKGAVE